MTLGPNFGSFFATNVLIADQDGIGPDGQVNDFVQGTGFNEDIYINSSVTIGVDGGGGFDSVNYAGVSGGIDFTSSGGVIFAARNGGALTDALTDIDFIEGTAFSDTFNINLDLMQQNFSSINGNSPVPPFGNPSGENGQALESPDGGRLYSAAEIAAMSGLPEMPTGDEDFIFVDQDLFNAGAEVTYLTAQGEGVIWLESGGVTQMITYTGIFHEVQQTEFFGGLPDGTVTGLNDTGGVVLDFSGSDTAIDASVLSGISLFNIVDTFIGTDLGDVVDLALTGLDDFFGGAGDDDITGTAMDNVINGGAGDDDLTGNDGDDILAGGLGADVLDGGAGSDTADYSGAASGVKVDIVGSIAGLGEAAGDSFISIENIIGSEFQDQLYGTAGANVISAGAGNDFINGRGGADTIDGGAGTDRYYASLAFGSATLDLSNQANNAGQFTGASFTSIEQFYGSNDTDNFTAGDTEAVFFGRGGDDILTGGAGTDRLRGDDGDDIISGGDGIDYLWGGAGADSFDGGEGRDRVSYNESGTGVTVYMTNPGLGTGIAAGDSFTSIEEIQGSFFDDIIIGSNAADRLLGNDGDDALAGGAGNDLIQGGDGNDRIFGNTGNDNLYGQDGADMFVFAANSGVDTLYDFAPGSDQIEYIGGPASMADLTFTQLGSTLEITSVNGTIRLLNLTEADLDTDDFIFNGGASGNEIGAEASPLDKQALAILAINAPDYIKSFMQDNDVDVFAMDVLQTHLRFEPDMMAIAGDVWI